MHKEGAAFRSHDELLRDRASRSACSTACRSTTYVDQFTFTRFEPQGTVEGHPNIKFATSIVDYIFRVLGVEYLGRMDMVQVPPQVTMAAAAQAAADEAASVEAEDEAADEKAAEAKSAESRAKGVRTSNEADEREEAPRAELANGAAPVRNGNGHGSSGHGNGAVSGHEARRASKAVNSQGFTEQLTMVMKDAPFCDTCGHLTVRNGACYKCLNCGQSVGCS